MNREYLGDLAESENVQVDIVPYSEGDAELDEMWSFVGNKKNKRWLWLAICHETRVILAFVFGRRTDKVFLKLKALLSPFGVRTFYTDGWGAYIRKLPAEKHIIAKSNTQLIERKILTLRTRIKRLARKTICFSKSETMHDIVIGLPIYFIEFSYFHFLLTHDLKTVTLALIKKYTNNIIRL